MRITLKSGDKTKLEKLLGFARQSVRSDGVAQPRFMKFILTKILELRNLGQWESQKLAELLQTAEPIPLLLALVDTLLSLSPSPNPADTVELRRARYEVSELCTKYGYQRLDLDAPLPSKLDELERLLKISEAASIPQSVVFKPLPMLNAAGQLSKMPIRREAPAVSYPDEFDEVLPTMPAFEPLLTAKELLLGEISTLSKKGLSAEDAVAVSKIEATVKEGVIDFDEIDQQLRDIAARAAPLEEYSVLPTDSMTGRHKWITDSAVTRSVSVTQADTDVGEEVVPRMCSKSF